MFGAGARTRLTAAVVALAAAVGVGVALGRSVPIHARGPLAAAVASLPSSTTVAGFTDWDSISKHHGLGAASDRDLDTRSALVDEEAGLKRWLGVRLRDFRWEIYGQGSFGDAAVVRLKQHMPTESRLRSEGYTRSNGIWVASGRLATAEPIYGAVALFPRDGVLVMATRARSVAPIRAVIAADQPSFASDRAVAEAVRALAGSQTALIQTRGLGCDATVAGREPETERQVEAAEARFGRVVRYGVLGRGLRDVDPHTQRFVVAMTFGSAATASSQARIRGDLSHGPFIGRMGAMSDVLRLRSATADGSTAVLVYDHPADSEYLMTGQGPLLPASC